MSEDNPIRIFVTHTFFEHPDYIRVFEYLESSENFYYKNCSDPNRIPGTGGREALKEELRTQLQEAEVVLLPAGLYAENQDWIKHQIDAAQVAGIPIVALEHFGGVDEVHPDLEEKIDGTVGWNDRLIIDAVRRHARNEDTTRFETIEFEMP